MVWPSWPSNRCFTACSHKGQSRGDTSPALLRAGHMPAYLDEMEWRFNNRENPYLFRDTMVALLQSGILPYSELIE